MKSKLLLVWTVLILSTPILVFSQGRQVTGTVTDERGNPLSGVSVMQKNTSNGTTTNAQGKFSLQNLAENTVLVFSSVGFKTAEATVNGSGVVNTTLQPDAQALEEVIAVAYGTTKKG